MIIFMKSSLTLLAFLLTLNTADVWACMPMQDADMFKTYEENYPNYDQIILAELIAPSPNMGGEGQFLLDVKSVIKGDMMEGKTSLKADVMSSCGFYPDITKNKYVVLLLKNPTDMLNELTPKYAFPSEEAAKQFITGRQ